MYIYNHMSCVLCILIFVTRYGCPSNAIFPASWYKCNTGFLIHITRQAATPHRKIPVLSQRSAAAPVSCSLPGGLSQPKAPKELFEALAGGRG